MLGGDVYCGDGDRHNGDGVGMGKEPVGTDWDNLHLSTANLQLHYTDFQHQLAANHITTAYQYCT